MQLADKGIGSDERSFIGDQHAILIIHRGRKLNNCDSSEPLTLSKVDNPSASSSFSEKPIRRVVNFPTKSIDVSCRSIDRIHTQSSRLPSKNPQTLQLESQGREREGPLQFAPYLPPLH